MCASAVLLALVVLDKLADRLGLAYTRAAGGGEQPNIRMSQPHDFVDFQTQIKYHNGESTSQESPDVSRRYVS